MEDKTFYVWGVIVFMIVSIALSIKNGITLTGLSIASGQMSNSLSVPLFAGLIILFLVYLYFANEKKFVPFLKHASMTLVIIVAIFAVIKYFKNVDILATILILTFGVWGVIWCIAAVTSLSKGSSLRRYSQSFLICAIFLLVYTVVDGLIKPFSLGTTWILIEKVLLVVTFTTFVNASYKMYTLGKEFGFSDESLAIKETLKKKNKH